MATSLVQLCKEGGSLPIPSDFAVHYPPEGAFRLSRAETDHFWFTERRMLILKLLHQYGKAGGLIADVGCGTGFTASWLTENGFPTIGIDAHPGFKDIQEKGIASGFIQGDILSVEPESEFDALLLLDTLEHLEDDRLFLNHVGKVLKPGGILILTVPAFQFLWSPVDDRAGHFRRYRKRDLMRFVGLPDTSLEQLHSTYFYGSILPLFFLSRRMAKKGDSINDDLVMPAQIMNIALKKILRFESFAARTCGIPIGSSLVAIFRKKMNYE